MAKIKVLVVEPCTQLHNSWQILIDGSAPGQFELICASSPQEGLRLFKKYEHEIFLIAVDACRRPAGDAIRSLPFIWKVRKRFAGPMIAISVHEHFQEELTLPGRCNYACEKHDLPDKICEIAKMARAA